MEMMKAYQEAGVNPFGSCLMILVQLPVWAALFTTLANSYELYGVPFTSHFLTDLTIKDPTYLLPVLLGVSQVITSRLQPPALDAAQQRMMVWFMPIFFTVIMLNYPAGSSSTSSPTTSSPWRSRRSFGGSFNGAPSRPS
jgi:YidC/Oxa1 family membrane protein insertase